MSFRAFAIRMKSTIILLLIITCSLACATESYCNQTWYTDKDGDCMCALQKWKGYFTLVWLLQFHILYHYYN